jgi:hypothetical protein
MGQRALRYLWELTLNVPVGLPGGEDLAADKILLRFAGKIEDILDRD